jgi:arsenate reductase
MAEAFLKSFDKNLEVYSAGTNAESKINPRTVEVMKEEGIDLSKNQPESIDKYLNESFDYAITVCDGAKEACPVFTGQVKNRLHIGFEDPAEVRGEKEYVLSEYRRIRDEIKRDFKQFYNEHLNT